MSYRKKPNLNYKKDAGTLNVKKKRFDRKPEHAGSFRAELVPSSTRETTVRLVGELQNYAIKYVLAGAFPVQFYGRERFSRDVDLVVGVNEKNAQNLFKLLKSGRYTVLYPMEHEKKIDSPESILKINLIKMKDTQTGALVDLILTPREVGFKFDNESEKRMKKVKLNGKEVVMPSPEDYLVMKLKARRPGTHDFEDIVSTLTVQFDSLDWNYLDNRAEEENVKGLLDYYKGAVEKGLSQK